MNAARWSKKVFVILEVMLFVAIPVLGYVGFRTLLDSRTGTFVDDPGPDAPGWLALVDPSPVVGVVELDQGRITGVAVVVKIGQTARGGAVILVPAELEAVQGQRIQALSPEAAVEAVAGALQLRIPVVEVVDADRWTTLLGQSSYALNNPDPVPAAEGGVLFAVGPVQVSGEGAAAFLGRTVDGQDSLAALVRRELFWTEMLEEPPLANEDPLSRTIRSVADGPHEVIQLPLDVAADGVPSASPDRTEQLIRRVVAFPAGDQADRRFRIRVEDRTGRADLDAVARSLGGLGIEVVAISNGPAFDDAVTAFRVEAGFSRDTELRAALPGPPIQRSAVALPSDPIVLQLGPDHEAILTAWASAR